MFTDGATVLIPGQQQQQQFLFLETILEETSDDLQSESDRSGPAGWADSDSDTESVIHVPNNQGMWQLQGGRQHLSRKLTLHHLLRFGAVIR
jgi:hypothetical protein